MLHHAPGGQFVVLRVDQPPGDGLEGLHEAGEVVELVESLGLGQRDGPRIVARAQLHQRGGRMVPSRCRCSSALGRRRMKTSISVNAMRI